MNQELIEVKVLSVSKEEPIEINGKQQIYQELQVQKMGEDQTGDTYMLKNGDIPYTKQNLYEAGDELMVSYSDVADLNTYQITDYVRRNDLTLLAIIFVIVTLVVAKKHGLMAILSMIFTFFIIFKLTLPMILGGSNPFLVSLLTIAIVIPVTFYLSHGFKKKTNIAIIATILSLLITITIAYIAVDGTNLTGYASEEASFVTATLGDTINIQGLLLAGIVIATLGVINDVTVAQASVVTELKKAQPKLKFGELYKKSMVVGRDHIASMVDTLVLTYTGASLPLLVLLSNGDTPWLQTINYEIIAEEIVRTLVASIGLILAVPITTAIAVVLSEN